MTPPLLITDDDSLRDELARLSAAAGVSVATTAAPEAAVRSWTTAPAVLVGADRAGRAAACALPRRPGVLVVSWGPAEADLLRAALALGAEGVCELPSGEGWLVELLTDVADRSGRSTRHAPVLGVVGGSGGAGATVLACALAQVAAAHGPCLLVDGDPLGPGADRVLGMEDLPGVRWDALASAGGRLGATSLREAVPVRERLGVLAWPPDPVVPDVVALREAVSAGRRGHDLVVVDLPRAAPGPAELVARCDLVLVVTGSGVPDLAATSRVCRGLGADGADGADGAGPVRLVVRGRGLDPGDVARLTGVRVLGSLPQQRGLAEAIDLGLGPVRSPRSPLGRAARRLLDACLDDLARPVGRAA